MKYSCCCVVAVVIIGGSFVSADEITVGPLGINSAQLNLNGQGIAIGQIESGRPAVLNFDNDPFFLPALAIDPKGVFERSQDALPNRFMNDHAMFVASVLISTDPSRPGVSPEADLYSSAFVTNQAGSAEISVIDATNKLVALDINPPDPLQLNSIRAINHSYVFDLVDDYPNYQRDGTTLLSLFVDWSARQYDVLHVFGVDENSAFSGSGSVPNDSFNGVSVSASERLATSGQNANEASFRKVVDFATPSDLFVRSNVDLIAPGKSVKLITFDEAHFTGDGTSFATPHVTGTIALLQQYGDAQVAANTPNWGGTFDGRPTARRHEVMKAVLMNSADKVKGILGMERTVLKSNGTDTWFDSNAAATSGIPLDLEMGAGHLNAKRALDQFSPGEFDTTGSTASIPLVGWDYGDNFDNFDIQKYVFSTPLQVDDYVSATLAWDRDVFLDFDAGTTGAYGIGDDFLFQDLNNLDLYLLPAGSTNINQAVAKSNSSEMNLEHFLFQIDNPGSYEIWVKENSLGDGFGEDFALAWWAGATVTLAGDFSGDGIVDATDIDSLFANYSSTDLTFDLTGDGVVDALDMDELVHNVLLTEYGDANLDLKVDLLDLDLVGTNFGSTAGWALGNFNNDSVVDLLDLDIIGTNFGFVGGASQAVPEPASMGILLAGLAMLAVRRRRLAI